MFRVRLSVDVQEGIGYQNRELSPELFARIAQGERVAADIEAHDRWARYGDVYYTAVWRTDTHTWAEPISADQVNAAYQAWQQEQWA